MGGRDRGRGPLSASRQGRHRCAGALWALALVQQSEPGVHEAGAPLATCVLLLFRFHTFRSRRAALPVATCTQALERMRSVGPCSTRCMWKRARGGRPRAPRPAARARALALLRCGNETKRFGVHAHAHAQRDTSNLMCRQGSASIEATGVGVCGPSEGGRVGGGAAAPSSVHCLSQPRPGRGSRRRPRERAEQGLDASRWLASSRTAVAWVRGYPLLITNYYYRYYYRYSRSQL